MYGALHIIFLIFAMIKNYDIYFIVSALFAIADCIDKISNRMNIERRMRNEKVNGRAKELTPTR